jgi:hypothetical protein
VNGPSHLVVVSQKKAREQFSHLMESQKKKEDVVMNRGENTHARVTR